MSLNPQQFFHPSSMINNVNSPSSHQPNPFSGTLPPATSPTSPISPQALGSSSGSGSPSQVAIKNEKQDEEPLPSTKELVTLLNEEGGLSVVDRVLTFKVCFLNSFITI